MCKLKEGLIAVRMRLNTPKLSDVYSIIFSSVHGDHQTEIVPFPGTGWIDRMAMTKENQITLSTTGETYSSAYGAILYDSPLEHPCRNFNAWLNSFVFGNTFVSWMIQTVGIECGHYILCYLRNFIGAMIVYYGTAGIFHYFCYVHPMSQEIFKDRIRPSWETIYHQMKLAQSSMFIYVLLPAVDEFLIESGWTRTYYTIDEIGGWPQHILTMIVYFSCVEIGIYWMHRTLHTNKWMYKNIHMCHHQYKKPETLTPWASIAFHPLDGILQASPYVGVVFFVPCHYLTHFGLLFFTAVRFCDVYLFFLSFPRQSFFGARIRLRA